MTEIRPIRAEECEPFLRLMCDVFDLDYERAYGIFFTEPFFDLNRKWALFKEGKMISILTTTPLEFGWGKAFGIAGVATAKEYRQEGWAGKLIEHVLAESAKEGEKSALLLAVDVRLYQSLGFEALDRVIRADVKSRPSIDPPAVESHTVRQMYDAWARADENRLRRDARRWNYWDWNYRTATQFQDGYLCFEPGYLREAIFSTEEQTLPIPSNTEWFGTTFMADQLHLPLDNIRVEMYLMGHNVPGIPQMFMTDQF